MTDNAVLNLLPAKKAASVVAEDERAGRLLFQRPKIWEVDEATKGDSWCD